MSNGSLNRVEKIDKIARTFGERGLQKLLVFKVLKTHVSESLGKRDDPILIERDLDRLCMEMASEIVDEGRDNPSENDLRSLMLTLARNPKR